MVFSCESRVKRLKSRDMLIYFLFSITCFSIGYSFDAQNDKITDLESRISQIELKAKAGITENDNPLRVVEPQNSFN